MSMHRSLRPARPTSHDKSHAGQRAAGIRKRRIRNGGPRKDYSALDKLPISSEGRGARSWW